MPLDGGEALDPFGGLADLERRILRVVSERSFADDPLRLLRAARLAAELGLEIEAGHRGARRGRWPARAAEPAGERLLAELRLLIAGPDPLPRARADRARSGSWSSLLPEVEALRGVDQTANHHLDVYRPHAWPCSSALLEVESDLERFAGSGRAEMRASCSTSRSPTS